MKKLSLIKTLLVVFCLALGFIFIYSEPNKTFVYFVDFFKVNSCLDQGDSWNYKDRKCETVTKLKIKTVNISSWKMYEDSLYDFKIKYPDSWTDPTVQEINDANSIYQYQVNFGTEKTLTGNANDGFSVFIAKRNKTPYSTVDKHIHNCNCVCAQTQENSTQEYYQEAHSFNPFTDKLPTAEDDTICYSYHFMGKYFEYELVPIVNTSSNNISSLMRINTIDNFKLAKNTFVIDTETIQKKAIEEEEARLAAIERARQARIAAEQARLASLRTCAHPERKPSYSTTKKKHTDEDCCPDPDEYPNPKCRYSAKDYSIMLKR